MMKPCFFPYLGYFGLINATDRWVVFDSPQYIRRGWVNRNRVLSAGPRGWKYLRVNVRKAAQTTPICQMQIADVATLLTDIVRCLDEYRCWRAPFYHETLRLLDDCLATPCSDLAEFLVDCLYKTSDHLQLRFDSELFSDLPVALPKDMQAGDWALATAIHLNATDYINPPGGRDIFDSRAFRASGIGLSFLHHPLPRYQQKHSDFISGLSIIDVLMWNGRDATRRMIDDYQIEAVKEAIAA